MFIHRRKDKKKDDEDGFLAWRWCHVVVVRRF
jgi:hypothetical protein